MDIRFLETFIAVSDCGSIAEAARRTNLTPAALAHRLRRLEEDLGQSLVSRAGRTIQLTAAGFAILDHARAIVARSGDLRAIAADGLPAGQLRLGATTSALTGLLPPIIARVRAQHPAVEYFVQPGASSDLYHRVVNGELDAALIVCPPFAMPKSCRWRTIREEPLLFIAPEDSAEAEPHDQIQLLPFIRYDRNQWGGQIVDRYLRDHDLKVREWLELDALEAIAALVDCGLGVSIVPDWAPPWPEGLRLRKIALPGATMRRTGIVWRDTGARQAAVAAFVQACTALSEDAANPGS